MTNQAPVDDSRRTFFGFDEDRLEGFLFAMPAGESDPWQSVISEMVFRLYRARLLRREVRRSDWGFPNGEVGQSYEGNEMRLNQKLVAVGIIAAAFTIPMGGVASADYGTQPGFGIAIANTECAGHGAFGAFGANGDVVHDFGVNNLGSNGRPGASNWKYPGIGTTGGNNSSLCGNGATPDPFNP